MAHLGTDSPPVYIDPFTFGTWPVYDGKIMCYFSMIRYQCGHSTFDLEHPEINHHPFCGPRTYGRVVCRNAFHNDAKTAVVSTTLTPGMCDHCLHNPLIPSQNHTTLLASPSTSDNQVSDSESDSDEEKVDGYMTPDPALGFIPEDAEADLVRKFLATAERYKQLGENLQQNLADGLRVGVMQSLYKKFEDIIVDVDDFSQLMYDDMGKVYDRVREHESRIIDLLPDGSELPRVVRDRGGRR